MRDLFKKVMTGSMVAGAALLVAACGGSDTATENNTAGNITEDLMGNDMTTVDAVNTTDTANLGVDANAVDTTLNVTDTTTGNTGTEATNTGTGTGNTTGM